MPEVAFDARGSMLRWMEVPGRTPARVFLHGLGGTGAAILGGSALDPRLGGHRTLVVDLPGHGLSDRPGDWEYSLDGHAAAVARACEAAGITGIDLVGHSLGADIAIVVAARNPGLVGRLVISEANLDPLPADPEGARFSQRIVAQGEAAFVERGYAAILASVPGWAPTLRLCDARAVFRSARGLIAGTTPTMRELFYGIEIPRMFIVGERGEPLLDRDGLQASGARVVVIPDAGHMMMGDQPDAFVAALAGGLEVE